MTEPIVYSVEYIDDKPETVKWLKRAGKARITYPNGDIYEGEINEGKLKHGKGKYIWKKKKEENEEENEEAYTEIASYEGDYCNGKKHGIGKMKFPNNDIYHGEWKDNIMEGEGAYMYANGDIYSGNFHEGKKSSENGTYEYGIDKTKLIGIWQNNEFLSGKWEMTSNQLYIGNFKNGQPYGKGKIQWTNGLQQEGEYNIINEETKEVKWEGGEITAIKA